MFEVVSGCLRLFQVVQLLRPVSNHVRLFEVDPSSAIVEVLMFVKPVSSHNLCSDVTRSPTQGCGLSRF